MLFVLFRGPNSSEKFEQIKPYSLSRNTATKLQNFRVKKEKINDFFVEQIKIYSKKVRIAKRFG